MSMSNNRTRPVVAVLAAVGTVAALGAPVTAPAGATSSRAGTPAGPSAGAGVAARPRHEIHTTTRPAEGTFTCGALTLEVVGGTEVETTDGDLRGGVARVSISRVGHHVRLHGSDGRTYRATGVTIGWFVLHAPDFDNPVSGLEVVQVMFRGGPHKSPGWLRERISITNGHERDVVTGPCDFG